MVALLLRDSKEASDRGGSHKVFSIHFPVLL